MENDVFLRHVHYDTDAMSNGSMTFLDSNITLFGRTDL